MMKKIFILAISLFAFSSMIFAYDMSVGVGFIYGSVNDTYDNYGYDKNPPDPHDLVFNRTQYGAFAFFGTRYTDFNFAVRYSNNDFEGKWETGETSEGNDTSLMLSVGAYVKIPFSIPGSSIVLFPTIGLDFDAVDDYTYIWFRGGIGMDLFFSERFFLRGQALYGYGIAPPVILNDYGDMVVKPGHGLVAKVAIGRMF
jgi:hypothetical protein